MSQPSRAQSARRQATPEEAKALAHPDRLRIIRLTFDEALTNKELADRLGRNPGTTLYHLRMLVATGFVAPEEARRGARGAAEVPYRSTGKSWTLDVGDPDPDVTSAMVDALRAELLESPVETRKASRLALRLTPEQRIELEARLEALVEEVASWPPADNGEPWALFVAMHERSTGHGSGSRRDPRLP
jgi:predicted ArsR family transcriptional regulator